MRKLRFAALLTALAAVSMVVLAGPGTKYGWWPFQVGFTLLQWGVYVGFVAAALAILALLALVHPRWRVRPWVPLVSLVLAMLAIAPPILLRQQARSVPPIHDITTDAYDPPTFVALVSQRKDAPNGVDYGGPQIAAQQQKGYPDIKPVVLKDSPQDALQKAIDAARSLGWQVVSTDAPSGRVEATDTTGWFGFKDDIVIRVRPDPSGGSRIDLRSVSRVGHSDLGTNAARVRKFISKVS